MRLKAVSHHGLGMTRRQGGELSKSATFLKILEADGGLKERAQREDSLASARK